MRSTISALGANTRIRHETISVTQPMRFSIAMSVSAGPSISTRLRGLVERQLRQRRPGRAELGNPGRQLLLGEFGPFQGKARPVVLVGHCPNLGRLFAQNRPDSSCVHCAGIRLRHHRLHQRLHRHRYRGQRDRHRHRHHHRQRDRHAPHVVVERGETATAVGCRPSGSRLCRRRNSRTVAELKLMA